MAWQTMDTAPKDGTEILGVFVGPYSADYSVITWLAYPGVWVACADGGMAYEFFSEDPNSPTLHYWMPLPEPPKEPT